MEFLKLDEAEGKTTGGTLLDSWNEFFYGPGGKPGDRVLRGIYGFYPVQKAKDNAITVATFKDDTQPDKIKPPYLVINPIYGRGRVVWLGSGETWRLRQYREVWHERFWTKLVRYASAGSMGSTSRRIVPLVGDHFKAGDPFEVKAQFFGKDLKPLPQNVQPKPKVILRPPVGLGNKDLSWNTRWHPKSTGGGEWDGRFERPPLPQGPRRVRRGYQPEQARQAAEQQGDRRSSKPMPRWSNTRPDLAAAYELASEADDVLARIDDPAKKQQLKLALQRFKPGAGEGGDKPVSRAPTARSCAWSSTSVPRA